MEKFTIKNETRTWERKAHKKENITRVLPKINKLLCETVKESMDVEEMNGETGMKLEIF